MLVKMYRLFEERDGQPATLFHGVNGSRTLPLDQWIDAEVKPVYDGSPARARRYRSGFHLFETIEGLTAFLNRFRRLEGRVVCAVDVDTGYGVWEKAHSPAPVKLAGRIRITSQDWDERIKADDNLHLS
jgi:hypothetical protein